MRVETVKELHRLLRASRSILGASAISGVDHYVEHAEYEMAFEGLVLELMKAGWRPPSSDFAAWKALAVEFDLDRESVFDGDFWSKFTQWCDEPPANR